MKILVIYNPHAGNGRAKRLLPAIKRHLADKTIDADIVTTDGRGHAVSLAEQSGLADYDAVVASGGDGTLFEVLNGYVRNTAERKPPLGLIPNGTGNAFMKELGLRKSDWRQAVDIVAAGRTRTLDIGRLQAQGQTWHFLNIVGMGFVAEVATAAVPLKKLGNAAYTAATLLKLPRMRSQQITLDIDGETIVRRGVFVEVANSRYTGTTFLIAPRAMLDDGLLDVVLLKHISRTGLLRVFNTIYDGSHVHHPAVEYFQARSIQVTEEFPGSLIPDGEILAGTPARFDCLPGAIEFLWPAAD
jgi:YegS/Rv2252/BmrU family lipid kinase